MIDVNRYGPWAVIAGGSEGVGAAMARDLAAAGFNLVLLARKPGPLAGLERELAGSGVQVRTVQVDLLADDLLDRIGAVTDDVEVGLYVHNAGANSYRSEFVDSDPAGVQGVIDVNVTAPLALVRHFGSRMKRRGRGGIILVGSLSAFAGTPVISIYCAAKAFLRIFAEGLWAELRPYGVDVLEVTLGLTRTPAMERLGYSFDTPGVRSSDPAVVAAEALAHLGDGPSWVVDGNLDTAIAQSGFPRADIVGPGAERYRAQIGA